MTEKRTTVAPIDPDDSYTWGEWGSAQDAAYTWGEWGFPQDAANAAPPREPEPEPESCPRCGTI